MNRPFLGLALLVLGSLLVDPICSDSEIDGILEKTRHEWQDDELSIKALTIDLEQSQSRTIDEPQAIQDVERLFELLAHGYSGYGFFSEGNRWDEARELILTDLAARKEWPVSQLPEVFRRRLTFIRDFHLTIGSLAFAAHRNFWFDTEWEIRENNRVFVARAGGDEVELTRIDNRDPAATLVPSLNRQGEKVYRIGWLSAASPAPIVVEGMTPSGPVRSELQLRRSTFDHYSQKPFRRDVVGGIPVLRVRTFSDFHEESLTAWVETAAEFRDVPCIIVDIRGNRGGNERWPIEWIRQLTGRYAPSSLVFSELHSRTSMAGRINAFAFWLAHSPESEFLKTEAASHRQRLEDLGPGGQLPAWTDIRYPPALKIPCDTTVVLVTNGLVGSAGEGLVMRASRLENVVVVGENTRGALTFGNVSLHRLPHSGLDVWMPINVNLFPDAVFREEVGLAPDYWVPARDAVDFAVAGLRHGTIPTLRPIPPEHRGSGFVGETDRLFRWRVVLVGLALFAAVLVALVARGKGHRIVVPGTVWLSIGVAWVILGSVRNKTFITDIGSAFVVFGLALTAIGLARRCQVKQS